MNTQTLTICNWTKCHQYGCISCCSFGTAPTSPINAVTTLKTKKHTHTQFVVLHLAGPLLLPNIDSCMSSSLANNIATSTVFNPSRNWLHRSTAKETKNHYLWQRKTLSFQTHFTIERPCSHIVHDIKNRSKDTCHERFPIDRGHPWMDANGEKAPGRCELIWLAITIHGKFQMWLWVRKVQENNSDWYKPFDQSWWPVGLKKELEFPGMLNLNFFNLLSKIRKKKYSLKWLHSRKLTWQWNIPLFNYIFKWWIVHYHVSFQGTNSTSMAKSVEEGSCWCLIWSLQKQDQINMNKWRY